MVLVERNVEAKLLDDLYLKETTLKGLGVFTKREIIFAGEEILTISGEILDYDEIEHGSQEDNIAIQVGERTYLGPSGGIDDCFNHSCNPNCGVRNISDSVVLIALREIAKGEELTFDYSTCMYEDNWEMDCRCGEASYRRRVRDFKYLPRELQDRYLNKAVVLDFIAAKYRRESPNSPLKSGGYK